MPDQAQRAALPPHGARTLPWGMSVDAYNAEIRAGGGFLGDQASSRAFKAILDHWRAKLEDADALPAALATLGRAELAAVLGSRAGVARLVALAGPEATG